ncbi:hypothetical protein GCM10022226_05230 [Sphaerisporangium flaviroseum]|uniref:Uncharacterized protein n=1 Tax=Sphaerisporangium flaviroseum TaxID=509199 RepID=A0ABP7HD93_9ACTN
MPNSNIPDTPDNANTAAEEAIVAVRPEAGRSLIGGGTAMELTTIGGGTAMELTTIGSASKEYGPARRAPEERKATSHRDML